MAFEEFYRLGLGLFWVFSFVALAYVLDINNRENTSLQRVLISFGLVLAGLFTIL